MVRAILLAAVLVVIPALCTGGVLLHPCDCGSEARCTHEVECASDPCGDVALRQPAPTDVATADQAVATLEPFAHRLETSLDLGAQHHTTHVCMPGRPYPASDVPLRI